MVGATGGTYRFVVALGNTTPKVVEIPVCTYGSGVQDVH
jgi:hypothetical protein